MASRNFASRHRDSKRSTSTRLYTRAVLCSICGITEYQLTLWEREELLMPAKTLERDSQREELYDQAAFERIRLIRSLAEDLEVNLPGISVILHLLENMRRG